VHRPRRPWLVTRSLALARSLGATFVRWVPRPRRPWLVTRSLALARSLGAAFVRCVSRPRRPWLVTRSLALARSLGATFLHGFTIARTFRAWRHGTPSVPVATCGRTATGRSTGPTS